MSKKGFLKIEILSIDGLKSKEKQCTIKVVALDTHISTHLSQGKQNSSSEFYLPVSEKIELQLHTTLPHIGFFELPIKKIYEYPTKRHLISINCVTKDTSTDQVTPEVYGVLNIALLFFENHIAKLDVLIDKVQITQEKNEGKQREIYVQCMVGNVQSQTTLKKDNQTSLFEWKQVLPFTLQSIPGKIQLFVKEKDMSHEQSLGKLLLDPQVQGIFEFSNNKQQRKYQVTTQARKIEIHISKIFKIPQNQ